MSIEFEQDNFVKTLQPKVAAQPKGLAGFLIKHSFGMIKNENHANFVMIGIFVCCFSSSIYLLSHMLKKTPTIDRSQFSDQRIFTTPPPR